jgi:hypothetical protein
MSTFKDRAGEPIKVRVQIPKEYVAKKLLKTLGVDEFADYPKKSRNPNF